MVELKDSVRNLIEGLKAQADAPDNPLRPDQRIGYEKLTRKLESALANGLPPGSLDGFYDIATGIGKTVMFQYITKALLSTPPLNGKKTRVLVVVPKLQQVEQTVESYVKFMPEYFPNNTAGNVDFENINMDGAAVGAYYTNRKDADRPITITTYKSLVEDAKRPPEQRVFKPENYEIVVLDEAHRALGGDTNTVLKNFEDKTVRVGCSATTEYHPEKTVAHMLGGDGGLIHKIDVKEGYEKDLLSPFACYTVYTGLDMGKENIGTRRNRDGSMNFNASEVGAVLNNIGRNTKAVRLYTDWSDPETGERIFGQTGIISCASIAQAEAITQDFNFSLSPKRAQFSAGEDPNDLVIKQSEESEKKRYGKYWEWLEKEAEIRAQKAEQRGDKELARRFREEGIQICAELDYRTPSARRRQIIADHKSGKLLFIAGVKIPTEGFDTPRASLLFSIGDTLSLVDKKQEGGRVLRLDPENPDKFARIFELVDKEEYLAKKGTDFAPVLYPETLSPNFRFRKHSKQKEKNEAKRTPLERERDNIKLPDIAYDIIDERQKYGQFEILQPEQTLEFCRKRSAARSEPLPAERKNWLSASYILENLGFKDNDESRRAIDELLIEMQMQLPEAADQTGGPYKDRSKRSMYISPELYEEKKEEISEYLVHRLHEHEEKLGKPLPANRKDWIPIADIAAQAEKFGLPAPSPRALQAVVDQLWKDRRKEEPLVLCSDPQSRPHVVFHGQVIDGPFFGGTFNSRVVHPGAVLYVLRQAKAYAEIRQRSLSEFMVDSNIILSEKDIAEHLNMPADDKTLTKIHDALENISKQRVINVAPQGAVREDGQVDTLLRKEGGVFYVHNTLLVPIAEQLGVSIDDRRDLFTARNNRGRSVNTRTLDDFFELLMRTPTPEELAKANAWLAEEAKKDHSIELRPTTHGQSAYFFPQSERYLQLLAKAIGCAPPIHYGPMRYLTPDEMAAKVGANTPETRKAFDEAVIKLREYYAKNQRLRMDGAIIGPHTRGDYTGIFIHPCATSDLQDVITKNAAAVSQVSKQQMKPLDFITRLLDPYEFRKPEKMQDMKQFLETLAAHTDDTITVSDYFINELKPYLTKQPSIGKKEIKLRELLDIGPDGKVKQVHPTLLPYIAMAADLPTTTRSFMEYKALIPKIPEEKKDWVQLKEELKQFGDVPSGDVGNARVLLSEWVRTGKMIDTADGAKSALETINLCMDENLRFRYLVDPKIMPAVQEELKARGKSASRG